MKKIAFSFYSVLQNPETCTTVSTPDYSCDDVFVIVQKFLELGFEVHVVQPRREEELFPGVIYSDTIVPDVDIAFFFWRWQMPEGDRGWTRQVELLDEYFQRGTKVIVADNDMKITEQDEVRWPQMIIGESSLDPIFLTRDRIKLIQPKKKLRKVDFQNKDPFPSYVYIGNDYQRRESAEKYIFEPASKLEKLGLQTKVYGNWIERNPNIGNEIKSVKFFPKISKLDSLKVCNLQIASIFLAKDEYYKTGFVTNRPHETLSMGTPLLIPVEHKFFHKLNLVTGCGKETSDIIKGLSQISDKVRYDISQEQFYQFHRIVDDTVETYVDTILNC